MPRIAVVGAGYVGLSIACLLAVENEVVLVDVVADKVEAVNGGTSPIEDADIEERLASGTLRLKATTDAASAYADAEIIVVAVPTNYDEEMNNFDTTLVEDVIAAAFAVNPEALIVIKSTIPVGFTERMVENRPTLRLLFSPEFLREGKALYDNLYPSRIIAGIPDAGAATEEDARSFVELLAEAAFSVDPPVLLMSSTEAEAVKLFANSYLAMRVAFFNELDMYAESKGLRPAKLIDGVTLDPRIGTTYCNPSFGYGGYCLPKDSKQLLAEFEGLPQVMIGSLVRANDIRKAYIADRAKELLRAKGAPQGSVGIYRLTMKLGSDNFRSSAIQDVMALLDREGYAITIFEPTLSTSEYSGFRVEPDLTEFKAQSDIIIANRLDECLDDVAHKVYSRDCLKG